MRWLGWSVVTLVLLGPVAAWHAAAQQPGRSNADAVVKASALEREARQIETMLIAPCCWREQVSVHQSEAAQQVKEEIRTMLGAGMVRQQVLDAFVERYGVRILAEPPDEGFGRVLYHAPWIVGVASAFGLVLFVRHITRRPARQASTGGTVGAVDTPRAGAPVEDTVGGKAAEESYNERLDEELRALD